MRLRLSIAIALALALVAAPAAADPTRLFGTGSTVTCDTTPNVGSDVDDTSVSNTLERTIACRNDSSESVYIGGSSVSTGGEKVVPGGRYAATLAPSVVPKCYAANSTSITCTESFGTTPAVGTMGGTGSRVELLASGTDTTVSATATLIVTTYSSAAQSVITLPAWCHSIQFEYRITSMSGGAPANFQIGFSGADPSGNALLVDGWISSTTVASPALGGGAANVLVVGKHITGVALGNISVTGTGTITYSPILPRNFKITRFFSSAPTTTLVAPWRLYCYGG